MFDLDGVVVDSEPVWERVRRQFVADHGGLWTSDAQQRLMGMSTPEWAGYLAVELGVGLPVDGVALAVVELMAAAYREELPLLPGAVDAVRRIAARWPVAVASSSARPLIDTVVVGAGLSEILRVTVSSEEVARGKPAPEVYLAAATGLGIAPSSCVAVEDSSNGLRSAAAAGMRVVAVPQPGYPPDPDALALAAAVLGSIEELTVELVRGLG
ncbi:MAG: HAD family phosphatase [Mycobacteriales bacterium]